MKSSIELNSDNYVYSINNQANNNGYHKINFNANYSDDSFCKTPTNSSSDTLCKFSLGVSNSNMIVKDNAPTMYTDYQHCYLNDPKILSRNDLILNQTNLLNNQSHSMPQLLLNPQNYNMNGQHYAMSSDNLKILNYQTYQTQSDSHSSSMNYLPISSEINNQNNEGKLNIFK